MRIRKKSYKPKAKKRFFNSKFLVGIGIAVLMATSIMGFIAGYSSSDSVNFDYNDFQFTRSSIGYATEVNDVEVRSFYLPDSVEEMDLPKDVQERLKAAHVLTITYDPNSQYADTLALIQYNLASTLQPVVDKYIQRTLTNNSATPNILQMDCINATSAVPAIKFKEGNETFIRSEGNCIIAQAPTNYDLQRLHDRILFNIVGVING